MLTSLTNFDPIAFLKVDTTSLSLEEVEKISQQLSSSIGEYILLKLSDELTQEQLEQVTQTQDGAVMLNMLRGLIPSADVRMLNEVENFKKECLEVIQKGS